MKQGKRPTRNQMKIIQAAGLNPSNWLIVKNQTHEMQIVHRVSGNLKTIKL